MVYFLRKQVQAISVLITRMKVGGEEPLLSLSYTIIFSTLLDKHGIGTTYNRSACGLEGSLLAKTASIASVSKGKRFLADARVSSLHVLIYLLFASRRVSSKETKKQEGKRK